jgi:hypothetical protein
MAIAHAKLLVSIDSDNLTDEAELVHLHCVACRSASSFLDEERMRQHIRWRHSFGCPTQIRAEHFNSTSS